MPVRILVALCTTGAFMASSIPTQRAEATHTTVMVLDIDGDGIKLTTSASGVEFRLEIDGAPRRTAWTAAESDDCLLAVDADRNGLIDSAAELLGNAFRLENAVRPKSATAVLLFPMQGFPLGPNGQTPVGGPPKPLPQGFGRLDASDPGFGALRVWRDRDHDGVTDTGELFSLTDLMIRDISLGFRSYGSIDATPLDAEGNRRVITGAFHLEKRGVLLLRELVEVALAN